MTHFGFFTLPATGHVNPMTALGREVQDRGHRVTFYQVQDYAASVEAVGLRCRVLGKDAFPLGSVPKRFEELGQLRGLAGLKYSLQFLSQFYEMAMREAPALLHEDGVNALVVDQAFYPVNSVGELLKLPCINACNCLMLNEEAGIPPFSVHWKYSQSVFGRLRTQAALQLMKKTLYRPLFKSINKTRNEWGLPKITRLNDCFSKLAQIAQQPREFEFPRKELPECFHFAGPFHRTESRAPVDFPWERLDGRPLVFASMGTIQNGKEWVFRVIAEACAGFDVQLAMSLGGNIAPESLGKLPANTLAVRYAPQLELLKRAHLVITHAGLNTALEALAQGVPMVAIPVTNDQPAVAARIAWTGTGTMVPLKKLTVKRLRDAIAIVLRDERYRAAAQRMKASIAKTDGLRLAGDIIERCCP